MNALVAVQIDAEGQPKELWRSTQFFADAASPLLYRSVLYLVRNGGILTSIEPETGQILRRERVQGLEGNIFASPVAADGKLYIVNEP